MLLQKAHTGYLQQDTEGSHAEGHRLLLADLGSAVVDRVESRPQVARQDVIKAGALAVTTWPSRAPEVHFGDLAFGFPIDCFAAGVVAWECMNFPDQLLGESEDLLGAAYSKIYGRTTLARHFSSLPLWRDGPRQDDGASDPQRAIIGVVGAGLEIMQGLLAANPGDRWEAARASQHVWFTERPRMKVFWQGVGGKGLFGISTSWLADGVAEHLRGDDLFSDRKQKELQLSWEAPPSNEQFASRVEMAKLPESEHTGKYTISGHFGKGSLASAINGMDNSQPLPFERANVFLETVVAINREALLGLWDEFRAEIRKEFSAEELPKPASKSREWANVRDFLYEDPLAMILTAPQIHFQKYEDQVRPMPRHYDGGKAVFVMAVSVWSDRILRIWADTGESRDLRTKSGSVYMAHFTGCEHQVIHSGTGNDATESAALGRYECVLFARCATFRHNRCSCACMLYSGGVDGRLCHRIDRGYANWLQRPISELVLPTLADLEKTAADRRSERAVHWPSFPGRGKKRPVAEAF